MDTDDVLTFVDHSESVLEASPQMNEANTKASLIRPFIELLGWQIHPSEVELEYTVQMGRKNSRVDYALHIAGDPVVFIEAKGSNASISDADVGQLKSYIRQELDVDWGVVTNGKSFEILMRDDSGGEEISLFEFDLAELREQPELLEVISREAIESGRSEEIASGISQTESAIQYLEEHTEPVASNINQVIVDAIGPDTPLDTHEHALSFVKGLITSLEEQRESMSQSSVAGAEHIGLEAYANDSPVGEPPTTDIPYDDSGRYVIRLEDDGEEVAVVSGRTQGKAMIDATNYLIGSRSLLDMIDVPWVPGRKKAIINKTDQWEAADAVYKKLDSGYYLDTKISKSGKQREVQRMAKACGLSVTFDGNW